MSRRPIFSAKGPTSSSANITLLENIYIQMKNQSELKKAKNSKYFPSHWKLWLLKINYPNNMKIMVILEFKEHSNSGFIKYFQSMNKILIWTYFFLPRPKRMCYKGLRNLTEEYQGLEYTLSLGKVTNSSEGEGGKYHKWGRGQGQQLPWRVRGWGLFRRNSWVLTRREGWDDSLAL